ncbi:MAG TPA: GFA family protein, partial [Hansschlegelia sp.]
KCATALWLFDPNWPELLHPFASAIDSELPIPPARTHLMLGSKASWVEPAVGPDDLTFDEYPAQSIEEWHRSHGLWVD